MLGAESVRRDCHGLKLDRFPDPSELQLLLEEVAKHRKVHLFDITTQGEECIAVPRPAMKFKEL